MKTLYVYADFDWLDEPMLVGELGYESLRGSDSYSFKYDNDWLRQYGSLFLSADINNYPGQQYTQPDRDIFGCFSDALPDRWGRLLLNRREQILAAEEKRPRQSPHRSSKRFSCPSLPLLLQSVLYRLFFVFIYNFIQNN